MDTSISRLYPNSLELRKKYQTWRGKNSFCCKGKVYIASGYKFGLLTLSYIIAYCLVFIVFIAVVRFLLIKRLDTSRPIIISLELATSALTLLYCSICIFSDPGVLPVQLYTPSQLKSVFVLDSHRLMFIRGYKFKIKFCKSCLIIRPPGVFHCKKCGGCIEKFDHHCPWVGNCIGKNNYRYFFCFLIFFNILLYFNLITGITYLINKTNSLKNTNKKLLDTEYMGLVSVLLSVLTCGFVTTLFIYHIYFSTRNISTYANIKMTELFLMFGNPFSRKNMKKNCFLVFCKKYYKKTNFLEDSKIQIISSNNKIKMNMSKLIVNNRENQEKITDLKSFPIQKILIGKSKAYQEKNIGDHVNDKADYITPQQSSDEKKEYESNHNTHINPKFKTIGVFNKKHHMFSTSETEETSKIEKRGKKSKLKLKRKYVSE